MDYTDPKFYEEENQQQHQQRQNLTRCPGCGGPLDQEGNCVNSMRVVETLLAIGLNPEARVRYQHRSSARRGSFNCLTIVILVIVIVVVLVLVSHGVIPLPH